MNDSIGNYRLTELVPGEIIDGGLLKDIEARLLGARENGQSPCDVLQVDGRDNITLRTQLITVESLMEVVSAVRRFRRARDAFGGMVRLVTSVVPFQLEPFWHAEGIPDAFVVTTAQATEGLSGKVPGMTGSEANAFVLDHARTDPEFTNLPGVRIVRPQLHSLVHIPVGALHRSPVPGQNTPAEKLIINVTVSPEFR